MSDQPPASQAPPQPQAPAPQQEFSPALRALGKAISSHPHPAQVAFCGVQLYMEVLGSGRVKPKEFLGNGATATGEEPEGTLKVQFLAIAGQIVVSFDPTLPPDGFRLGP